MTELDDNIPTRLQEIITDFQISQDSEKLELLLEFAERMPGLPDHISASKDQFEEIPECMTPVSVHSETNSGRMTFYFDVPPESPTIRGYAALLADGLEGSTPEAVLSIPGDFYRQMGLDRVLSHQRLNGIAAILAHIKRMALQAIQRTSDEDKTSTNPN